MLRLWLISLVVVDEEFKRPCLVAIDTFRPTCSLQRRPEQLEYG